MHIFADAEFWVVVAFVIFVGVLFKVGAPRMIADALDTRAARIKTELDTAPANANRRKAELERLWKLMMARRQALAAHPVFRNLDETGGQLLFPRSSSPP